MSFHYSVSGLASGTLEIDAGLITSISVTISGYDPFIYSDSGPTILSFVTQGQPNLDGTVISFYEMSITYYSPGFHLYGSLNDMYSSTGKLWLLTNHQLVSTGTATITCADDLCRPVPAPEAGAGILSVALLVAYVGSKWRAKS